jgi:hypothetical protein
MGRYPCRLLIAVCALTLSNASAWAESAKREPGVVSSLDRFSGRLSMGDRETLRAAAPNIHYQVLSLAPGTRAAPVPPANSNLQALRLKARGGFVVYELRAGKLTTIIDGKRQERREGEFWLVRPGEDITLEADDDSVVVQTIQIPDF